MPNILGVNSGQGITALSPASVSHQASAGQITGATTSFLNGPSSQSRIGVMYAPFASKDIMIMALGQNIPKAAQGKELLPLIVKNDHDKTTLEQYRQAMIQHYTERSQFPNIIESEMQKTGFAQEVFREQIGPAAFDKAMSGALKFGDQADILKRIDIRSNDGGEALAGLHPQQHKLYILGHGGPGMNILAADSACNNGMVSAAEVAQHLKEGGLNKDFNDFRVTACYSADTRSPTSFHPKDLERAAQSDVQRTGFLGLLGKKKVMAEPFAQSLSNELKRTGFERPSVTGYHAAGVTISGEHHSRRIPDSQVNDVRSSTVRQRFIPV
ncbi:hypothetical protein [Pseudomonas sp. Irchel 3E19]|uniref:hypothetical protein n=1 Tax=Pseudomonas sp. Irchel 3E19 TaxID=2008981 RepID=UPI00113FC5AD|nr:hypothetical protein [Pseudomonas sp. Irchel 3E19]